MKNPDSTQKCPVWYRNTWFDKNMPGSTQKCPTQHAWVAIAIVKHPPSSDFFPILLKYIVF